MSSRHNNSYERRRHARRPLVWWHREVCRIDFRVREGLGITIYDRIPFGDLAFEVLTLAHPDTVPGLDVVIPGTRSDLARRWIEARLSGRGEGEDFDVLAREIAPLPDEHLVPYYDRKAGRTRYRSTNKRQDEITRAAISWLKTDLSEQGAQAA